MYSIEIHTQRACW